MTKKIRVLCVEDDPVSQRVISVPLERQGFAVETVSDGHQALEALAKTPPDIVLLDVQLPGLSGYDVLRWIRSTETLRHVAVIMVTALTQSEDIVAGLEMGADDYVSKPLNLPVLAARIRNCVRRTVLDRDPPLGRRVLVSPLFTSRGMTVREGSCFVLMPFTLPWSDRVWNHLRDIAQGAGYEAKRGDELYGHDILEDIWIGLNEASVIIADVTDRNPNVMYEVGVAHTLGKTVILITQEMEDIPFDFRRYRHLAYADDAEGFAVLADQLPKYFDQMGVQTQA